ncbi:uncharacterized protein LOC114306580 [Camellia sinensis]|uniref:uncharacterized protein LOC114306580 n=1 Tax=Camellia sinensis TaxID=4442 RepID=UPI0010360773|nr:uncharacterized protein LOC114306580 [Camellia sinensis]
MVSILVNSTPTEEFQPQKGLRQGDRLSPFLFIVAAEDLNLLLERAIEKGLTKSASGGSDQLDISHLQFADDTIIFCEGGMEEVLNIKRVLRCFEVGVVKSISKLQANFLWGGSATNRKVHMVKWKEVAKSKNQGGLGVRDLGVVNECLLLKWWWRYGSDDKALWKSVLCSRYGKLSRGWTSTLNQSVGVSIVWKDISQLSVADQLFSLSTENEDSLQQIKAKFGASVGWQLQFRRNLLAWEEDELQRLLGMLVLSPCLRVGVEDSCSWLAEKSGKFSVASMWR